MSWFLNAPQPAEMPIIDQPLTGGEPTWFQGLTASYQKAQLENDSNFRLSRTTQRVVSSRAEAALNRVGDMSAEFRRRGINVGNMLPQEAVKVYPKAAQAVIDVAREQAEANPEAWRDVDLTDENITAEVNGILKAEWEDAALIADMAPASAQFLGSMAGITADVKNLPFVFLGGGSGSFLRVAGREAFINMSAEAAFLPSQFEMADRLGIPDPDITSQLALAAGAGAILGGTLEAARRGITYWQGRSTVAPIPGLTPADSALAVDKVEDAILAGEDPILALKTIPPTEPVPPPGMPPLILTGDQRTDVPRAPQGPVEAAPQAEVAPTPQAPSAPAPRPTEAELDDAIAQQQAIIDRATKGNPLISLLARDRPINPDGPVGQILYGRDIRPGQKGTPPGLFSRKRGSANLDNLVAQEWDDRIPGIRQAAGEDGNGYLDQEGLIALIERAAGRDYDWLPDVALARKAISDMERMRWGSPEKDLLSGARMEEGRGLFIDPDRYMFDQDEFTARAQIAREVEGYIEKWEPDLTREARDEIIAVMQKHGGEVEQAIERVYERGHAFWRQAPDEAFEWIPGFDDPAATPQGADRGVRAAVGEGNRGNEVGEEAAGGGNAPARLPADADPAQLAIPDTDRMQTSKAQDDRATVAAMQQQSMIRRSGQTRVEDDPGGLFGGAQRELFSDPASPAARPILDNMAADFRDMIEREGDFMVDMGDGKGERSASSVLDDLDRGDEFADEIALCGRPKTNEAPF